MRNILVCIIQTTLEILLAIQISRNQLLALEVPCHAFQNPYILTYRYV